MTTFRYLTAGESHGRQLTAIVEGCPAGLGLDAATIDADLARRQLGFGRGARQQIEKDRATILSGVRYGRTTGAPITLAIANRDAANWAQALAVEATDRPVEPLRVPRPGHADLTGSQLYGADDLRNVIERSSARETAARVACGAVARRLLSLLGCQVRSHVVAIGDVTAAAESAASGLSATALEAVDDDPVRCIDSSASERMQAAIAAAGQEGDTLGGLFEVVVFGFPPGVGSYAQADRRLGARLAAALLGIPAIKGVEIGLGFAAARLPGSQVHDEIVWSAAEGYGRTSNHAGGIEGGISTGLPIVVRAAMKPIATLMSPLRSVRLGTHEVVEAHVERSDVCAVPAAAVVGEAVVALALAAASLERFGGETADELTAAVAAFRDRLRRS
jgi:chorismate synthase